MDCRRSIILAACSITLWLGAVGMPAAHAEDGTKRISLERSSPDQPIGRDAIIAKVKSQYQGRVLSIQEKPQLPSHPDCHIVRMLSEQGEYLTIKVACNN